MAEGAAPADAAGNATAPSEDAPRAPGGESARQRMKELEDQLAGQDPKVAEQVKQMMANMGLGGEGKKEEAPAAPKAPEKPVDMCKNCMEPCQKVLRCGKCKAATYCSAACQKQDWQFHKRTCKTPPVVSPVGPPGPRGAAPAPGAPVPAQQGDAAAKHAPARPTGPEREVVAGEDVGTWYNHREWRPADAKKEFQPQRLDAEAGSKAPKSASAWNAAGTWEEKNMLSWWQGKLGALKGRSVDSTSGVITVDSVGSVAGEAQIVHIRGTPRFLFNLSFELSFNCKFPMSSREYPGKVNVPEFSHELAASEAPIPVEVSAQSSSDKRAAETSLVPMLQEAFRDFVAEYGAQVPVPEGGAFPGQLPPSK